MATIRTEMVLINELKPHPRNYVKHPEDQIEHIAKSLQQHGLYRNIVIAQDNTILAGHGVVQAAQSLGYEEISVVRLDIAPDSPAALKVLTGDNEIRHLAEIDDRALTEILRDVKDSDIDGLLGTGFDEMMLANLVLITRPKSEIEDFDRAAEWIGLPDFKAGEEPYRIVISMETEELRDEFMKKLGVKTYRTRGKTISMWHPPRKTMKMRSLKFEQPDEGDNTEAPETPEAPEASEAGDEDE